MCFTCASHVEVNKYTCTFVLQSDTVISDHVSERNNNNRITYIYNNNIVVVHTLHVVIFMTKLIPYKNVYDGLMTMNIITTQIFPW